MEDSAMYDEVGCEEFYGFDDAEINAWLDELEIEWMNRILQEVADEQKAAQVEVELDAEFCGV